MRFSWAKLFPVLMLALLSTLSGSHALAQVVFESATGNTINQGISMGSENWLFHNFEVTETIEYPEVGIYLETYAWQQAFAAIVALDGRTDVPDSIDLSTPDLVGTATFDVPITGSTGADRSVIMPLTLQPGWYALGFGTGAFGVPDEAFLGTLMFNTDTAPAADPYGQFQDNHFAHPNTRHFYRGFAARFFVAIPPPSPDFDRNGYVDEDDLNTWQEAFGVDGNGDSDGDGDSDGADFLNWQRAYSPRPLLVNGDFERGALNPWSTFLTPNGSGSPQVGVFDVDGDGAVSNALRTRSGMFDFPGASPAGVGIEQSFVAEEAGSYLVSLDIASSNEGTTGNSAPGTFELFVDGLRVDRVDMTGTTIRPGDVIRDSLSAATNLNLGEHTLRVLFTRPAVDSTMIYQYVDDIAVHFLGPSNVGHSIPEPASALLIFISLVSIAMRRRAFGNATQEWGNK
jgi:hypothetical protein